MAVRINADEHWSITIQNGLSKGKSDEITIVTWVVQVTDLLTVNKTSPNPSCQLKPYDKEFLQWTQRLLRHHALVRRVGVQDRWRTEVQYR